MARHGHEQRLSGLWFSVGSKATFDGLADKGHKLAASLSLLLLKRQNEETVDFLYTRRIFVY